MNLLHDTIAALLITFLVSYLATPIAILLAKKAKLIDDPKKSSHSKVIHNYPTPRGGGLAISFSIIISSFLLLPVDEHLLGILLGVFLITILGLVDDRMNLSPYKRLLFQLCVAAIPISLGIGISFITNPFNGILDLTSPRLDFQFFGEQRSVLILADCFAVFWIVFLMNMLNMGAKGVDGQLSGVTAISAIIIAALSLNYSADITQWPVIILAVILAGAYLGFLPWHLYPQKIMPSYSGSTIAGYMLAILSILSTTKVGTLMVVLAVPLIDTGYTIVRRVVSGKSPVWGDRGHLHHKLLDAGLSKRKIAYFYWFLTLFMGLLALNLNASLKFYTMIGVAFLIGGLLIWLTKKNKT